MHHQRTFGWGSPRPSTSAANAGSGRRRPFSSVAVHPPARPNIASRTPSPRRKRCTRALFARHLRNANRRQFGPVARFPPRRVSVGVLVISGVVLRREPAERRDVPTGRRADGLAQLTRGHERVGRDGAAQPVHLAPVDGEAVVVGRKRLDPAVPPRAGYLCLARITYDDFQARRVTPPTGTALHRRSPRPRRGCGRNVVISRSNSCSPVPLDLLLQLGR